MIIYFSASTRYIKKDIDIYRKILHYVRLLGHVISRDWVETSYVREVQHDEEQSKLKDLDWVIVEEAERAIEGAELVIAEATDSSTFGVGYEVAYALQRRKPTLLLVKKEKAATSYASGLRGDFVTFKKYDDANLQKIIEDFIKENTIKTKDLRFNFVIDRQIYNHLRLRSYESGKTKAEIVRDLLLEDIDSKVK